MRELLFVDIQDGLGTPIFTDQPELARLILAEKLTRDRYYSDILIKFSRVLGKGEELEGYDEAIRDAIRIKLETVFKSGNTEELAEQIFLRFLKARAADTGLLKNIPEGGAYELMLRGMGWKDTQIAQILYSSLARKKLLTLLDSWETAKRMFGIRKIPGSILETLTRDDVSRDTFRQLLTKLDA